MDLGARLEAVERLGRLRDDGALTEAEFLDAKSKVLAGRAAANERAADALPQFASEQSGFQPPRPPRWAIAVGVAVLLLGVVGWMAGTTDWDTSTDLPPSADASQAREQVTEPDTSVSSEDQNAAASLEAQADALIAAGEAAEEALEASTPSSDGAPQPAIIATRAARCRVSAGDARMTGACTFNAFSETEFEVTQPNAEFTAQVVRQGAAIHGIFIGRDGSREDVGPLTQKGACWSNDAAEICAWAI